MQQSKTTATFVAAAVVLAVILTPGLGEAQESSNHLYPRFELSVSSTLLVISSTLRIDPEGSGTGTEISVEDDLGLSRTTPQPRGALRWRLGRRHELEGGFLRAIRSEERVLTDTIVFRDTAFAAGLRIESSLGTSQTFLNYRFAFTAREQTQIGVGVGLGVIFLRGEIDALSGATSGGADTAIREFSQEANLNGPTASLGLYGRFQLGDRWYLESDVRGVYIKISNFRAGVIETGATGRYFFSNAVGTELGYNLGFYAVRLDREGSDQGPLGIALTGKVRYSVQGVRIGLIVVF